MRAKSERISFSQNPILRSASLTGSIHEMTDDVRRISLDRRLSLEQNNLEEDLDQGCLSSSALNSFFFPFCVLTMSIRRCQIGLQGIHLCSKPRLFCNLNVATYKNAFLNLILHVLQLATSNSRNCGRFIVPKHL